MTKVTEKLIENKLTEVLDPELGISIVDMGLIYKIDILKNGNIKIIMTLTTIGCPLFSTIEQEMKSKLSELKIDEKKIKLKLTFDPPWTMDRMSESAKAMLGI